jgi:predicted ATPase
MCHVYRGELDQAQRVGEELLDLSRARDDAAGMVLGHSATGQSLMLAGKFGNSRPHFEALLGLYDPDAHATLVHQTGSHPLMTQAFLGLALFCLGFPEQAMARTEAAIADARRLKHPTSLAVGLAIGALLDSLAGDHVAAGRRADQLAGVANEQGMPFFRAWGAIYRGRSRIGLGDVAGGMSLLLSGVAAYRETGSVMWLPHFVALLAAGHAAAGQTELAEALLDDALQTVARTGERWFVAELNRLKGQLLQQQGQVDAAEDLYHRALGIAREQDARLWALRAAVSLARLRCEQGRTAEAEDLLGPVYGWFTEGLATPDLVEARSLLDRIQAVPMATEGAAVGGVLLAAPVVQSPLG